MADETSEGKSWNVDALVRRRMVAPGKDPAKAYIDGLGQGSGPTMEASLDAIAMYLTDGGADRNALDWSKVRGEHTKAVRDFLVRKFAPATSKKMASALRGVLLEARQKKLMTAEDFHDAVDAIKKIKGKSAPAGRSLSAGEIAGLFRVCAEDTSTAGRRDAAILAVAYAAGLRRSELVNLDLSNFDIDSGTLTVMGKGGKARQVFIASDGSKDALQAWLKVRGGRSGPLFLPIDRGSIENRRMTPEAIYLMLRRRAEQAGIRRFSPHDLRRSIAGDLLDAGVDIVTVQRMLGHANVGTTAAYDRRGTDAQRRAAELIFVPYKQPERKGRK